MATLQNLDAVVVCVCVEVEFLDELAKLLINGAFFALNDIRTVLRQQRFGIRSDKVLRAN